MTNKMADKYPLNKNGEGYVDPTAHKAIKRASKVKKIKSSESDEQKVVIEWANIQACKYPVLRMLYHIPNGGYRPGKTARNLQKEGVKPGVPDLHLPVSRNRKHGLWIEMKVGKNTTSKNQEKWINRLIEEGHEVKVCYGADEAIKAIKEYLGI